MKRWIVAGVALAASIAVSATLLIVADPSRGAVQVASAAHDIPAGSLLDQDLVTFDRITIDAGSPAFFTRRDVGLLSSLRATHDLAAGQLIQRSDVAAPSSITDRRLVFVPVKDVPPVSAGDRVDLLLVTGDPGHPTVEPFAVGIDVRAATASGLVVEVPASKAAAFVYAGSAMQLVAVVAESGSGQGAEMPVANDQQAIDIAGSP